ncbi:5-dehydro-4-deoxy-D-glucuronate isomerase [Alicyclobacillus sp. SO9]|uniref:5-dehydro-4-deoxy-D-glucuronate isomerase n=1 Tax=Alicyclobacillus sp. SO9 TaxID=2665646 RepID=UPI0018E71C5A|nr:5-dehydro-4-deoxy-D-glucuronate isomerase [Alicyclobacillus sp. SO9]QQE80247.1 5-dehydro-4-deoxy-D-glucuronate isomerase [Alicyclobacillus sp. SO9]
MKIRYASHPEDVKHLSSRDIYDRFTIRNLFVEHQINTVFSHHDRGVVLGIVPISPLTLEEEPALRASYFLERREMGLINIGGDGTVQVDGETYTLHSKDGMYIGRGAKQVTFSSLDSTNAAKFYGLSGPAHKSLPTTLIRFHDTMSFDLGSEEHSNKRVLRRYIHEDGVQGCSLAMGMTVLSEGSVWNTMPPHVHDRRSEVYMYFNVADGQRVFHFMGEPNETRHVIIGNEDVVISPSWSIHSGAGTSNYSFIWGTIGENVTFSDMDNLNLADLR